MLSREDCGESSIDPAWHALRYTDFSKLFNLRSCHAGLIEYAPTTFISLTRVNNTDLSRIYSDFVDPTWGDRQRHGQGGPLALVRLPVSELGHSMSVDGFRTRSDTRYGAHSWTLQLASFAAAWYCTLISKLRSIQANGGPNTTTNRGGRSNGHGP